MHIAPLEPHAYVRLDDVRLRRAWRKAAPNLAKNGGFLIQTGQWLLERLEDIKITPKCILDLGDRSGTLSKYLQEKWPKATVITLTFEEQLARQSRYRTLPWRHKPHPTVANGSNLPFKKGQFDLVISNMAIHWTENIPLTLKEIRRILANDGLLLFNVAGSETLMELTHCLKQLDQEHPAHTQQRGLKLPSLHQLGDLLLATGFILPVTDRDLYAIPFDTVPELLKQLKNLGAGNHNHNRAKGLMGKEYLSKLSHLYQERFGHPKQALTFNMELLFGHAWKSDSKKRHNGVCPTGITPTLKGVIQPS